MIEVRIRFPPGVRAVLSPDGRRRLRASYTVKRWFDDPRRLTRFLHLCAVFNVPAQVDRPVQGMLL